MKNIIATTLALMTTLGGVLAQTTFQGGEVTDPGNWSNGLPDSKFNPGQLEADGIFPSGPQGFLFRQTGVGFDLAEAILAGGTIGKADSERLVIGSNGVLLVEGGALLCTSPIGFNRARFDLRDGEISGGSIYMYGTGGDVSLDRSSVSGGTLKATELALISETNAKEYHISGGTIAVSGALKTSNEGGFFTFASGGSGTVSAGSLALDGTVGYINFEPGSGVTLTVNGYDGGDFRDLYEQDKLRFDGSSTSRSFDDVFEVAGDTLSLKNGPAGTE